MLTTNTITHHHSILSLFIHPRHHSRTRLFPTLIHHQRTSRSSSLPLPRQHCYTTRADHHPSSTHSKEPSATKQQQSSTKRRQDHHNNSNNTMALEGKPPRTATPTTGPPSSTTATATTTGTPQQPSFVEQAKQTLASASETAQATTKHIVQSAQSGLGAVQEKIFDAKKQMGLPTQEESNQDMLKSAEHERGATAAQKGLFPEAGSAASYEALYSTPLSAPSEFTTLGSQTEGPSFVAAETEAATGAGAGTGTGGGGGITGALSGMAHKVTETMSSAAEKVGSMVGIGGGGGAGTGTGVADDTETMSTLYDRGQGTGSSAWEGYKQKASDTATAGQEAAGRMAETGQRRTSEMGQAAREKTNEAYNQMGEKVQGAKDSAGNMMQATREKANETYNQMGEKVQVAKDTTGNMMQATRDKASETYNQMGEKAQGAKDTAGNMMQGMKERTVETTEGIKQQASGAWQGVKEMLGAGGRDDPMHNITKENVHTAQPTLTSTTPLAAQDVKREQEVRDLGDQAKARISEMQRRK
jgi:hypothetical protein